jgi:Flp pilus assembly protein TadG
VAELAVALPLLCLLVFLVTEAASLVRIHQILNNAAREGARISALTENRDVPANAENAAKEYVKTYAPTWCQSGSVSATADQNVVIGTGGTASIIASRVTVSCTYNVLWVPPFFGLRSSFPLTSTAVFQNFY